MTVAEAPRRRDPEATRAAILEAAERLFVEKGFAATSMSDIALNADVTKSLIHHHFGSKEELWSSVKRQRLSHYADGMTPVIPEGDDAKKVIVQALDEFFEFLRDNPDWVRINLWMSLEGPKVSDVVRPDLVNAVAERLAKEQQEGNLRSDVDPRHALAMFISVCLHWFMARDWYRQANLTDGDERSDEAYLADVRKVFLDGLFTLNPDPSAPR